MNTVGGNRRTVWGLVSPRNRVHRFDETTSGYATSPLSLMAAAAGCVSLRMVEGQ